MNSRNIPIAKIYFSLLCGLAFLIPISQYISVRLLVVLSVGFFLLPEFRKRLNSFFLNAWEMCLYLLLLFAGLIYSDDVTTGLRVIETSFSLLAMPLVFSGLGNLDEKKASSIFLSFASGLTVASLVILGVAISRFQAGGNLDVFFFEQLTQPLGLQPTYLSYYLIFCMGYGLYLLYYDMISVPKGVSVAVLFFFFFMLVLTAGRTTFISLLLIFSFFVLKYTLEQRNRIKHVVFVIVCGMLVMQFAFNSAGELSKRLSARNDYWERSPLWRSAIEANTSAVFGVGTGDYKAVLNDYLEKKGLYEFAEESYNSHNQFIQVYFSNGIIGLAGLLLMLGRPLYLAIRSEDMQGILTMFPFIIYGMTEVFLGRFQGVIFFALLHQLTVVQNINFVQKSEKDLSQN